MRRLPALAALAFGIISTTASGQWVEDSIDVGPAWVGCLAYNSRADVVYGSSESGDLIFAISCETNEVIARTWAEGPGVLVYSPSSNKAYCAGYGGVYVIDGATHHVVSTIPLPSPSFLAWDSCENVLYVQSGNEELGPAIAVVDCATDSVVSWIDVGGDKMYINSRRRKMYVLSGSVPVGTVTVVDLDAGRELGRFYVGYGQPDAGCFSEAADRFYCGAGNRLLALDGNADTVVSTIDLPVGCAVSSLAAVESRGLILASGMGQQERDVFVLDAGLDSVLGRTVVGRNPIHLAWSRTTGRVYCSDNASHSVSVLSDDGLRCPGTVPVGGYPFYLLVVPEHRRVYVSHLGCGWICVIRDEGPASEGVGRVPGDASVCTIVRDRVWCKRAARLVDASGRLVGRLFPGWNDLGALRPGVYTGVSRNHSARLIKTR